MTDQSQYSSPSTTKRHRHDQSTSRMAAVRVLDKAKKLLTQGEDTDVADLLEKNPELKLHKSLVLGLAYEEYCHRLDAGEPIEASVFCSRFPSFQNSLYMAIELNRLLENDSALKALCDEPKWPEPGESFLDYSLISELGCGSFAHVFLASEPALGERLVVLKIAPRGGEEAEIVGKLRHPNIVPIHSIKNDSETELTAICMPYLGCTTLCDLLDYAFAKGKYPLRPNVICQAITELNDDPKLTEAPGFDNTLRRGSYVEAIIHLAVQVADALSYAHTRCICHLDIKPSNVLLSVEGRPLLLDFNLSVDGKMDAWKIGGTLPYMSPEQLRDVIDHTQPQPIFPDPRSDLFSLGIVVYQLLSGVLPFGPIPRDATVEEIAKKFLCRQKQGPLPLREKNPQVDGRLAAIVESCLAFDPEERPQSAEILTQALRQQLAPRRRIWRWIQNHPRRVSCATTAIFSVLFLWGLFLALRPPYDVRQFRQGQHYAEMGKYHLAVEYLDKSVEADPNDPEALFARGRVRLKLGQYDLAAIDFRDALRIKPGGELETKLFACQGLCASKMDRHAKAEMFYRKTVEAGFESPGLFNNLGYTYLKLGRDKEAELYLKKAIKIAPDLQAAHNNLLLFHMQRSGRGIPITELVLEHTKQTVETAPPSAELYHRAATLFAQASKNDPSLLKRAKEYARLAIRHHLDPKKLSQDSSLFLRDDPEFQQFVNRSTPKKKPVKPVLFLDPLDNSPSASTNRPND